MATATAADYTQLAQQIYQAYLWRPADYNGMVAVSGYLASIAAPTSLADLQAAYATNISVKNLLDNFSNSAESVTLNTGMGDALYVNTIYSHLLNRDADLAGLSFWVGALHDKVITRATVATQIIAAATKDGANAEDHATIVNKLAFSTYFTETNDDTPARLAKYAGDLAATTARILESAVTGTTTPEAIKAMVDQYWDPVPIPLVGISLAETLI